MTHAAKGDWAFFALAGVLALATQLTIIEVFEKRPRAAMLPTPARLSDEG